MRVNREDFLSVLMQVQPGISAKEVLEQSGSFVFQNGMVISYNDQISCRCPSKLDKKFEGAVQAEPLINVLSKIPEEEIELNPKDGELIITGKRRSAGIRMDKDIMLPVHNVDEPTSWIRVHEDFSDGVAIVQEAAGRDASKFAFTCVHIHPKWIECCDGPRAIRFRMKTGITDFALIRKEDIRHIVGRGMTEFSESPSWIHFRNKQELVYSCRRFVEEFPTNDVTTFLKMEGEPADMPKGLKETCERAEIFSEKNSDNNLVQVILKAGKVTVEGRGPHGWYRESKKINYQGRELIFLIGPKMLAEIASKFNKVIVSEDRIKIEGGKWKYVASLGRMEDTTPTEE